MASDNFKEFEADTSRSTSNAQDVQDAYSSIRSARDATSSRIASRSTSPRLTRSATTPILPSAENLTSPFASREGSPSRTLQTAARFGTTRPVRSRKNSTEQSPQRASGQQPVTTQSTPSATAVHRAITAAGLPKLASPIAPSHTDLEPRKEATAVAAPAVQSKLKSPTSTTSRFSNASSSKASNQQQQQPQPQQQQQNSSSTLSSATLTPTAHGGSVSKPTSTIQTIQEEDDSDGLEPSQPSRAVTSGGGGGNGLETVQEGSHGLEGAESASIAKSAARPSTIQEDPDEDNPDMVSSQTTSGTKSSKATAESGSGSEGAVMGKDKEREKGKERMGESQRSAPSSVAASRKPSVTQLAPSKPTALQTRRSFQHLNPTRNKVQSEGSVKSMTVETETVSNPDLLADDREGRGTGNRPDGTGSVRAKASTETIRPRKERRRIRKPTSIASGTASSKADIFEAKVMNAVDEAAHSSDSEETFVYESNPPEPRSSQRSQQAHRYHHSRTPSAASMKSQPGNDGRGRGHHYGVVGKKSMKFTNATQFRDADDEDGTSTYSSNTARSSHRPHHHVARHGRPQNASQESDTPSSGPVQSPRVRQMNSWRGPSLRMSQNTPEQSLPGPSLADKSGPTGIYDLSGAAEADDEFTPLLVPGGRSSRNDTRRRAYRYTRTDAYHRNPLKTCARLIRYTFMTLVIVLAISLLIAAMVFCNRQLQDLHVRNVRNVLASEQELFLEMEVRAINPNLVDISIAGGSLSLFARSKYVGTTQMWRSGTIPGLEGENSTSAAEIAGGVDEGTDPIEEPGSGTHTMLLGSVRELESPLVFESSPFDGEFKTSIASLRLAKPGNKTEEGGSRRWENVLQHPFELLIRGRLNYLLPLSSKNHFATVIASTTIKPDKPSDDPEDDHHGNEHGGPGDPGDVHVSFRAERSRRKKFWA